MVKQGKMRGNLIALGRIMRAPQVLQPAIVAVAEQRGDDDRSAWAAQISTWLPSSTTRLGGRLKNSIALSALRSIQEKSFSRHSAMPGFDPPVRRVWRRSEEHTSELQSLMRISYAVFCLKKT